MDLDNIKKIHFIGIGGIGVSAIAKLMLQQKKIVSGSDKCNTEIVKKIKQRGAKIFIGHKAQNLAKDIELVVFSPAVPEDNPERQKAEKLKIPAITYPQFLQILSQQLWTIAVSGTNGKSTTTSLAGLILEKGNIDPTVIVGSFVKSFPDENLRIGKSKYFIVEGCEYKENMLNLDPKVIILTNIEKDHLDYYRNLQHIKKTFSKYVKKLPKDGTLIYNTDDKNCIEVSKKIKNKISYGIKNKADVMAKNICVKNEKQFFDLWHKNKKLGVIELKIPGTFNIYNTLAAITAALLLKVSFSHIEESLASFPGIWRRYEYISDYKNTKIISDYAHHPTAIKNTIKATKDFFPSRRIVAVFQPHSWSRTRKLFKEFTDSFNDADIVILSEVYQPAGRENTKNKISSHKLVATIKSVKQVFYAKNPKNALQIALKNLQSNDILLIMGAGDIYKIASEITNI